MEQDIFKKLAEQIKESGERWEKIDEISNGLKHLVDSGIISGESYNPSTLILTIKLVLLLVEQLRPISSSKEQISQMQNEIENMLGSLIGRK